MEFLELWVVEFEVSSRTIERLIPKDGSDKANAVLGDSSGSRVQRRLEMKRSDQRPRQRKRQRARRSLGRPGGSSFHELYGFSLRGKTSRHPAMTGSLTASTGLQVCCTNKHI